MKKLSVEGSRMFSVVLKGFIYRGVWGQYFNRKWQFLFAYE